MKVLTKVEDPVLGAYFTLRELAHRYYIETSWKRPVIWIDNKRLPRIWGLHTNEPRGSHHIVGFRFKHPVKELREESTELGIDDGIGVRGKEFKSGVLHNTEP